MPTIHARHPLGYLITFDAPRDQIDESLAWLAQHGYTPDLPTGDQWRKTPSGQPICPRHHVEMRQRQKQHDTWYSHQIVDSQTGEILYCRGYATGKEADGYNL